MRGLIAALMTTATLLAATASAAPGAPACAPVQQLRIYHVPTGNIDAFHARFRDHAARIMARHGFEIVAMWQSTFEERIEFIYLLEWPDIETLRRRWAAFMADEEWKAIKRETAAANGSYVESIEDRVLCLVDYSPRLPERAGVPTR